MQKNSLHYTHCLEILRQPPLFSSLEGAFWKKCWEFSSIKHELKVRPPFHRSRHQIAFILLSTAVPKFHFSTQTVGENIFCFLFARLSVLRKAFQSMVSSNANNGLPSLSKRLSCSSNSEPNRSFVIVILLYLEDALLY